MDNKEELTDFQKEEKNLQEAIIKRNREEILSVAHDLEASFKNEPNAKLREDIFVNVFLPFFSNEENTYHVGLGNWERVASNGGTVYYGLYKEVDIVDSEGAVLFSVPPMYDRDAFKPVKLSRRIALEDMFKQAEVLAMIKPELALKSNTAIFAKLLSAMRVPDNRSKEYLTRWYEIFKRYGKIKEEENAKNQNKASEGASYEIEDL